MQNTTTYDVLSRMNRKEIQLFREWLDLRKKSNTLRLFDLIIKMRDTGKIHNKRTFYKLYFENDEYSDTHLRNKLSLLLKDFKHFTLELESKENSKVAEDSWLRWMVNKGMYKIPNREYLKQLKSLGGETLSDKKVARRYKVSRDYYWMQILNYDVPPILNEETDFLQYHDEYHLLSLLSIFLNNAIYAQSYGYEKKSVFHIIIEDIRDSKYWDSELVKLYYWGIRLLTVKEDREQFKNFSQLLKKLLPDLDKSAAFQFTIVKINLIVRNIHKKWQMKEIFELLKENIDNGVMIVNGSLKYSTYSNVVVSGIRIGELDWLVQFIKKYKRYLRREHREDYFNLSMGRVLYAKKDNQASLDHLNKVERIENQHQNFEIKYFQLLNYYDLNDAYSFKLTYDSLTRNLYRKIGTTHHWEGRLTTIKLVNKLMQVKNGKSSVDKLKKYYKSFDNLSGKDWIKDEIERLASLEKK